MSYNQKRPSTTNILLTNVAIGLWQFDGPGILLRTRKFVENIHTLAKHHLELEQKFTLEVKDISQFKWFGRYFAITKAVPFNGQVSYSLLNKNQVELTYMDDNEKIVRSMDFDLALARFLFIAMHSILHMEGKMHCYCLKPSAKPPSKPFIMSSPRYDANPSAGAEPF